MRPRTSARSPAVGPGAPLPVHLVEDADTVYALDFGKSKCYKLVSPQGIQTEELLLHLGALASWLSVPSLKKNLPSSTGRSSSHRMSPSWMVHLAKASWHIGRTSSGGRT